MKCMENGKFEGEGEYKWDDDPSVLITEWEWPTCTVGCVDFPDLEYYRPIDETPLLPTSMTGMKKEYVCSISSMMPHTGVNPIYECLENGSYAVVGTVQDVPVCVPKTSCRLPEFPEDVAQTWGYTHNNTDKVAYNFDEYIEYLSLIHI